MSGDPMIGLLVIARRGICSLKSCRKYRRTWVGCFVQRRMLKQEMCTQSQRTGIKLSGRVLVVLLPT